MGCIVRREIAKSKPSQDIKAVRARQAHYIQWCIKKGFKDPVGQEEGWEQVIAIYVKYVMIGVNYNNLATLRLVTCKNYADDVAKLFKFRIFQVRLIFKIKQMKSPSLLTT